MVFPIIYVIYAYILGKSGVRWTDYNLVMPYNFLNYKAPCGWFGLRPDTIGPESLGIGVAYMILILTAVFALDGVLTYFLKKKILNIYAKNSLQG